MTSERVVTNSKYAASKQPCTELTKAIMLRQNNQQCYK